MKLFFIVTTILIVCFLAFLSYMGAFQNVVFENTKNKEYVLVYKTHVGDYAQSGKAMDDIFKWLLDNKIKATKGFGLYFDNPKKVDKSQLRSMTGCVLEETDYDKIELIKKKFLVKKIASYDTYHTTFPYRNKMSIALSVMKVYSALVDYITKNDKTPMARGMLEIYNMTEGRIEYYMPKVSSLVLLEKYYYGVER